MSIAAVAITAKGNTLLPGDERRDEDLMTTTTICKVTTMTRTRTRSATRVTTVFAAMVSAGAMFLAAGCSSDDTDPMLPDPCGACDSEVPFTDRDLSGIMHLRMQFPGGEPFSAALRLEAVGEDYDGVIFGRAPKTVTVSKDRIEVDLSQDGSDGPEGMDGRRIIAITAIEKDGSVTGTFTSCTAEECFTATVAGSTVEPLDEPVSSGVTLIAEYGGPATGEWRDGTFELTLNVRVHDDLAYLARARDGLRIVDLSTPATPVERGHIAVTPDSSEYYNDVKIVAGPKGPDSKLYALMASNLRGIVVIDVSDPDAPVEVTSFPGAEDAVDGVPSTHTLFVEGTRAYVAYSFDDSLRIYDISNPATPAPMGSFRNPRVDSEGGYLHDLFVEDGRAYLNYWNLGMTVVDTRDDPANPVMVGEYDDYGEDSSHSNWVTRAGGRTISVHGDEQYGAHVRVVDVDDDSPEFLKTLGSYKTRDAVSVHNILAHGERAFVTYYQDGLRILDLSDPRSPTLAGHFHTWPGFSKGYGHSFFEGAIGVDFDATTDTIYLADTHRGLLVLSLD